MGIRIEGDEIVGLHESLGQSVLKTVLTYLQDQLTVESNLRDYQVSKDALGRLVFSPKLPENTVTWLNAQIKAKRKLGKFEQNGKGTIFDPHTEAWVGAGKRKSTQRRRQ